MIKSINSDHARPSPGSTGKCTPGCFPVLMVMLWLPFSDKSMAAHVVFKDSSVTGTRVRGYEEVRRSPMKLF